MLERDANVLADYLKRRVKGSDSRVLNPIVSREGEYGPEGTEASVTLPVNGGKIGREVFIRIVGEMGSLDSIPIPIERPEIFASFGTAQPARLAVQDHLGVLWGITLGSRPSVALPNAPVFTLPELFHHAELSEEQTEPEFDLGIEYKDSQALSADDTAEETPAESELRIFSYEIAKRLSEFEHLSDCLLSPWSVARENGEASAKMLGVHGFETIVIAIEFAKDVVESLSQVIAVNLANLKSPALACGPGWSGRYALIFAGE